MQKNTINYGILVTALFLFGVLLLPSLTTIHHALTHHTSIVCNSDISTHFHESEFNCDFQDIVLVKFYYPTLSSMDFSISQQEGELHHVYSVPALTTQRRYFSLRAPPLAV
ncbi:MAG: hypothetical protein WBM55_08920 [Muriicola sp.]